MVFIANFLSSGSIASKIHKSRKMHSILLSQFAALVLLIVEVATQSKSSWCYLHNCPCTQEYIPFCGSDGFTYTNHCQLRCAQRHCSPDLRVKFEGVCAVPYRHEDGSRIRTTSRSPPPPRPVSKPQPRPVSKPQPRPGTAIGRPWGGGHGKPVWTVVPIIDRPILVATTRMPNGAADRQGVSWEEARPNYNIDWRK